MILKFPIPSWNRHTNTTGKMWWANISKYPRLSKIETVIAFSFLPSSYSFFFFNIFRSEMRGIQTNIKYQEALFNIIMHIILFAHLFQANSIPRMPLSHWLTEKEEALMPRLHRTREVGEAKGWFSKWKWKIPFPKFLVEISHPRLIVKLSVSHALSGSSNIWEV